MHKLIIFPCRERVAVRRSDEHLALSREPAHRRHWNFGRAHSDQLGRRDQHLATWLVAGGPGHRSQRDRITDLSFGPDFRQAHSSGGWIRSFSHLCRHRRRPRVAFDDALRQQKRTAGVRSVFFGSQIILWQSPSASSAPLRFGFPTSAQEYPFHSAT